MYRNNDLSDKIFNCLLTAMAKVQSVDRKTSFVAVSDVNAYHEEWHGSSTITMLCRAALGFASSSGC